MALVALGSCTFMMAGYAFTSTTADSGRVATQIVTGIGFLRIKTPNPGLKPWAEFWSPFNGGTREDVPHSNFFAVKECDQRVDPFVRMCLDFREAVEHIKSR